MNRTFIRGIVALAPALMAVGCSSVPSRPSQAATQPTSIEDVLLGSIDVAKVRTGKWSDTLWYAPADFKDPGKELRAIELNLRKDQIVMHVIPLMKNGTTVGFHVIIGSLPDLPQEAEDPTEEPVPLQTTRRND